MTKFFVTLVKKCCGAAWGAGKDFQSTHTHTHTITSLQCCSSVPADSCDRGVCRQPGHQGATQLQILDSRTNLSAGWVYSAFQFLAAHKRKEIIMGCHGFASQWNVRIDKSTWIFGHLALNMLSFLFFYFQSFSLGLFILTYSVLDREQLSELLHLESCTQSNKSLIFFFLFRDPQSVKHVLKYRARLLKDVFNEDHKNRDLLCVGFGK